MDGYDHLSHFERALGGVALWSARPHPLRLAIVALLVELAAVVGIALLVLGIAYAVRLATVPARAAGTAPAALFATICIDGTLHGLPKALCHEFQLRGFPSIAACESARQADVNDWLANIRFLQPHLVAERCGPAEPDTDGDDI